MKIAVTGGAGFIGSNLCDFLVEKNHSILCIDNFNDYYSPNIKRKNIAHLLKIPSFKLLELDIKNKPVLENLLRTEKPDAIVHLAALPGVRSSIENPSPYIENNIQGTLNLLQAAKDFSTKIIFASSSSVYGDSKKIPFKEDDPANSQLSPYAFSKRAGELLCQTYNNLYNIPIVCFRFFTVFGIRNRPDMAVSKFTRLMLEEKPLPVYGSTDLKRDYTFVDDIVPTISTALETDFGFEIVNLGNNKPEPLSKLISAIEESTGKKALIENKGFQKGDAKETCADIEKAKRLFGYNPKVSLEEGIQRFVKWYKKNN